MRPAASTFHFQETGSGLCGNVCSPGARGAGSEGAEDAAGDAAVGWVIFSESNPITSKEGVLRMTGLLAEFFFFFLNLKKTPF